MSTIPATFDLRLLAVAGCSTDRPRQAIFDLQIPTSAGQGAKIPLHTRAKRGVRDW